MILESFYRIFCIKNVNYICMKLPSTKKIISFFYRALRHSTAYGIFGADGIKSSLFYKALCLPYRLTGKIQAKHGEKLSAYIANSHFAKYINFNAALFALALFAPFCAGSLYFTGTYLLLCYFLKGAVKPGFISMPTAADAIIFLFAFFYFAFSGGFSLYALLALFCYRAVVSGTRESGIKTNISICFIVSSAAAAILGVFASDALGTEFYILMIPFCFSAAFDLPAPYREISLTLGSVLSLVFFTVINGENFSPAAIALVIYLCLRDIRYFVPIMVISAAVFGIFSDILSAAAKYEAIIYSGAAALVLSPLFYLNLPRGVRKKAFVRSVTAAICASGAAFVSTGGTRLGFVFWLVVALSFPSEKRLIYEKT